MLDETILDLLYVRSPPQPPPLPPEVAAFEEAGGSDEVDDWGDDRLLEWLPSDDPFGLLKGGFFHQMSGLDVHVWQWMLFTVAFSTTATTLIFYKFLQHLWAKLCWFFEPRPPKKLKTGSLGGDDVPAFIPERVTNGHSPTKLAVALLREQLTAAQAIINVKRRLTEQPWYANRHTLDEPSNVSTYFSNADSPWALTGAGRGAGLRAAALHRVTDGRKTADGKGFGNRKLEDEVVGSTTEQGEKMCNASIRPSTLGFDVSDDNSKQSTNRVSSQFVSPIQPFDTNFGIQQKFVDATTSVASSVWSRWPVWTSPFVGQSIRRFLGLEDMSDDVVGNERAYEHVYEGDGGVSPVTMSGKRKHEKDIDSMSKSVTPIAMRAWGGAGKLRHVKEGRPLIGPRPNGLTKSPFRPLANHNLDRSTVSLEIATSDLIQGDFSRIRVMYNSDKSKTECNAGHKPNNKENNAGALNEDIKMAKNDSGSKPPVSPSKQRIPEQKNEIKTSPKEHGQPDNTPSQFGFITDDEHFVKEKSEIPRRTILQNYIDESRQKKFRGHDQSPTSPGSVKHETGSSCKTLSWGYIPRQTFTSKQRSKLKRVNSNDSTKTKDAEHKQSFVNLNKSLERSSKSKLRRYPPCTEHSNNKLNHNSKQNSNPTKSMESDQTKQGSDIYQSPIDLEQDTSHDAHEDVLINTTTTKQKKDTNDEPKSPKHPVVTENVERFERCRNIEKIREMCRWLEEMISDPSMPDREEKRQTEVKVTQHQGEKRSHDHDGAPPIASIDIRGQSTQHPPANTSNLQRPKPAASPVNLLKKLRDELHEYTNSKQINSSTGEHRTTTKYAKRRFPKRNHSRTDSVVAIKNFSQSTVNSNSRGHFCRGSSWASATTEMSKSVKDEKQNNGDERGSCSDSQEGEAEDSFGNYQKIIDAYLKSKASHTTKSDSDLNTEVSPSCITGHENDVIDQARTTCKEMTFPKTTNLDNRHCYINKTNLKKKYSAAPYKIPNAPHKSQVQPSPILKETPQTISEPKRIHNIKTKGPIRSATSTNSMLNSAESSPLSRSPSPWRCEQRRSLKNQRQMQDVVKISDRVKGDMKQTKHRRQNTKSTFSDHKFEAQQNTKKKHTGHTHKIEMEQTSEKVLASPDKLRISGFSTDGSDDKNESEFRYNIHMAESISSIFDSPSPNQKTNKSVSGISDKDETKSLSVPKVNSNTGHGESDMDLTSYEKEVKISFSLKENPKDERVSLSLHASSRSDSRANQSHSNFNLPSPRDFESTCLDIIGNEQTQKCKGLRNIGNNDPSADDTTSSFNHCSDQVGVSRHNQNTPVQPSFLGTPASSIGDVPEQKEMPGLLERKITKSGGKMHNKIQPKNDLLPYIIVKSKVKHDPVSKSNKTLALFKNKNVARKFGGKNMACDSVRKQTISSRPHSTSPHSMKSVVPSSINLKESQEANEELITDNMIKIDHASKSFKRQRTLSKCGSEVRPECTAPKRSLCSPRACRLHGSDVRQCLCRNRPVNQTITHQQYTMDELRHAGHSFFTDEAGSGNRTSKRRNIMVEGSLNNQPGQRSTVPEVIETKKRTLKTPVYAAKTTVKDDTDTAAQSPTKNADTLMEDENECHNPMSKSNSGKDELVKNRRKLDSTHTELRGADNKTHYQERPNQIHNKLREPSKKNQIDHTTNVPLTVAPVKETHDSDIVPKVEERNDKTIPMGDKKLSKRELLIQIKEKIRKERQTCLEDKERKEGSQTIGRWGGPINQEKADARQIPPKRRHPLWLSHKTGKASNFDQTNHPVNRDAKEKLESQIILKSSPNPSLRRFHFGKLKSPNTEAVKNGTPVKKTSTGEDQMKIHTGKDGDSNDENQQQISQMKILQPHEPTQGLQHINGGKQTTNNDRKGNQLQRQVNQNVHDRRQTFLRHHSKRAGRFMGNRTSDAFEANDHHEHAFELAENNEDEADRKERSGNELQENKQAEQTEMTKSTSQNIRGLENISSGRGLKNGPLQTSSNRLADSTSIGKHQVYQEMPRQNEAGVVRTNVTGHKVSFAARRSKAGPSLQTLARSKNRIHRGQQQTTILSKMPIDCEHKDSKRTITSLKEEEEEKSDDKQNVKERQYIESCFEAQTANGKCIKVSEVYRPDGKFNTKRHSTLTSNTICTNRCGTSSSNLREGNQGVIQKTLTRTSSTTKSEQKSNNDHVHFKCTNHTFKGKMQKANNETPIEKSIKARSLTNQSQVENNTIIDKLKHALHTKVPSFPNGQNKRSDTCQEQNGVIICREIDCDDVKAYRKTKLEWEISPKNTKQEQGDSGINGVEVFGQSSMTGRQETNKYTPEQEATNNDRTHDKMLSRNVQLSGRLSDTNQGQKKTNGIADQCTKKDEAINEWDKSISIQDLAEITSEVAEKYKLPDSLPKMIGCTDSSEISSPCKKYPKSPHTEISKTREKSDKSISNTHNETRTFGDRKKLGTMVVKENVVDPTLNPTNFKDISKNTLQRLVGVKHKICNNILSDRNRTNKADSDIRDATGSPLSLTESANQSDASLGEVDTPVDQSSDSKLALSDLAAAAAQRMNNAIAHKYKTRDGNKRTVDVKKALPQNCQTRKANIKPVHVKKVGGVFQAVHVFDSQSKLTKHGSIQTPSGRSNKITETRVTTVNSLGNTTKTYHDPEYIKSDQQNNSNLSSTEENTIHADENINKKVSKSTEHDKTGNDRARKSQTANTYKGPNKIGNASTDKDLRRSVSHSLSQSHSPTWSHSRRSRSLLQHDDSATDTLERLIKKRLVSGRSHDTFGGSTGHTAPNINKPTTADAKATPRSSTQEYMEYNPSNISGKTPIVFENESSSFALPKLKHMRSRTLSTSKAVADEPGYVASAAHHSYKHK